MQCPCIVPLGSNCIETPHIHLRWGQRVHNFNGSCCQTRIILFGSRTFVDYTDIFIDLIFMFSREELLPQVERSDLKSEVYRGQVGHILESDFRFVFTVRTSRGKRPTTIWSPLLGGDNWLISDEEDLLTLFSYRDRSATCLMANQRSRLQISFIKLVLFLIIRLDGYSKRSPFPIQPAENL